MPRNAEDLRRLGGAVTTRRTQLKLSKDECARRASMSNTTWTRVEDGLGVRDTTYSRVDDVLGWPTKTCEQILDDPDFHPFPSEKAAGARYSNPPVDEAALRQAIQNATIATVPDLTGAQIMALQERAIEELRKRGKLPGA
jgi:transcriptional regulator with XRE-family HTH domain